MTKRKGEDDLISFPENKTAKVEDRTEIDKSSKQDESEESCCSHSKPSEDEGNALALFDEKIIPEQICSAVSKPWRLQDYLSESWKSILNNEFGKDYISLLEKNLRARPENNLCPPINLVFEALNLCPYENVRVVILGQDPYHVMMLYFNGNAMGMAFSVPSQSRINPSLQNIFKEIATDVNQCQNRTNGDLSGWARQGVLLLNTILTTERGKALAHQHLNWQKFTDAILQKINAKNQKVIFMLWGSFAKNKISLINKQRHMILTSHHPSPLSPGFLGCKHFSACNKALSKPIDWNL